MMKLRRYIATSDSLACRWSRRIYRAANRVAVPAPRLLVRPILGAFIAIRSTYYLLFRVLVCEPLFKAYCTSYGANLHTGVFYSFRTGSWENRCWR